MPCAAPRTAPCGCSDPHCGVEDRSAGSGRPRGSWGRRPLATRRSARNSAREQSGPRPRRPAGRTRNQVRDMAHLGPPDFQAGYYGPVMGTDQGPAPDLPVRRPSQPARGSGLPAPGSGLPTRGSGPPAPGSGLPTRGSGPPAPGSGLPARGSGLPTRTTRFRPPGRHRSPHQLSVPSDAPALILAVPGPATDTGIDVAAGHHRRGQPLLPGSHGARRVPGGRGGKSQLGAGRLPQGGRPASGRGGAAAHLPATRDRRGDRRGDRGRGGAGAVHRGSRRPSDPGRRLARPARRGRPGPR